MAYYSILSIGMDAKAAEIRAAYLRRALEMHPDKATGSSSSFQQVVQAFEVLSDSVRRQQYDLALSRRSRRLPMIGRYRPH